MTFDEILAQILDVLKRQGRVSYGARKRRYDLYDAYASLALRTCARMYDGSEGMLPKRQQLLLGP